MAALPTCNECGPTKQFPVTNQDACTMTIEPRWEWRAFFADTLPGDVRGRLGLAADTDTAQESNETYIVSSHSRQNVKIRNAQLEIKTLEAVSRGLERWRPTLKQSFPIDAVALRALGDALGVTLPPATAVHLGIADLLNLVRSVPGVQVMAINKRRVRLTVQGCAAERALLDVEGRRVETIAIEDVDAERVLQAVAFLELDPHHNESYPAALKRFGATAAR